MASGRDRTVEAVRSQIEAMGAEVFEVGLFKPEARGREPVMLPRVWDRESLLRSVGWLRHENRSGRNVYIRPKGEHDLSLVDDLTLSSVACMIRSGFAPAVLVETSPGNYQAWLKHPERIDKEMGTAAARALAEKFGGDLGAADWRHYGRLAGLTNRKSRYRDPETGLYPFVKLIRATGEVYAEAGRFLSQVRAQVEERHRLEQERRAVAMSREADAGPVWLKSIDEFRADPKYQGDGTRIDLAFAIYAVSHGVSTSEVEATLRTRDLTHKGTEKRQGEYIERTIRKALEVIERTPARAR